MLPHRAGHEVSSVCDGFEALSDIADGDFELLVTDIVMPCMDGFKLVRRTRLEIPSLKVIFYRIYLRFAKQLGLHKYKCPCAL